VNAAVSVLSDYANAALSFLYPEACQICGVERATPREGYVCSGCRRGVRFIRPPYCERCGLPFEGDITTVFECANCHDLELHFRSARSAVAARGTVLEAIHRYKYHRALWFEPFLAGLLISQARPALAMEHWDWLVPIPLHPAKERHREFNQARRLAARLAQATAVPVHPRLVERVKPTETQTHLSRHQRAENMHGAFSVREPHSVKGKRIVLLDDVFTTGATTSACAQVLRRAGAAEVCVWTVARGL
jgi:ComF family protein